LVHVRLIFYATNPGRARMPERSAIGGDSRRRPGKQHLVAGAHGFEIIDWLGQIQ
jgi:hypothetical protein